MRSVSRLSHQHQAVPALGEGSLSIALANGYIAMHPDDQDGWAHAKTDAAAKLKEFKSSRPVKTSRPDRGDQLIDSATTRPW
jgi:hypothetical protein